ncbi:DUF4199 domain-containing protein [Pontibacter sp. 172403-2]|uniref:DUF4199 domain-containing protein n=1 Tax=Pontibacter rufus TaxID=2791028 RepID=UPI0018AFF32F|nr:DUF4199 domain-containing protein [Pontibacter sp. 172403-2]MBF9255320.1 DUF4199 domain-containing protein [Pontibacter sp. 172403-2]
MTENQPSVTAVALKYGLITALVGIVYSLVLNVLDLATNQWLTSLSYLILIAGLVLAMKDFKANNYGYMSYGQGLGVGSLLSAIFGLLSGIFSWIYTTYIDPEFMARMQEVQRTKMLEQGLSDEQIDTALGMAEKFQNPITMIFGSMAVFLIIGFILSLIIAAIIKNKRPEFE